MFWPRTAAVRALLVVTVARLAACDDGSTARVDALEARIAALERRADATQAAIEPLAVLPATIEQQQQSAKSIRAEQATLVARLARAEESIAALQTASAAGTTAASAGTTAGIAGAAAGPKSLEVGIPECDAFLTKYYACLHDHIPEPARKAALEALEQSAQAWRDAAAGPGRAAMAGACTSAAEATAKATAAMGCTW